MEVVEEDFKNVLKTEHPFSLKFFSCFAKLKLKPCDAFFPSFFHCGKGVIFLLLLCFRRNDGWSVGLAAARTDSAQKGPRSEDGAPCCGPEEQSDDRHPTGSHPEEGEMLRTVSCIASLHDNHLKIHHHICLILKTQNILLILIQHPSTSKSWRKSFSPFEIKILRYLCVILLLRYNV